MAPLVYYVHADHLNTPRVVVGRDNVQRWRWMAEPFGTTAAETGPGGLPAFTYNLRFPGQFYDAESEAHYNMQRDYFPGVGRYAQSDPIGLAGGINTYAYVEGNPISNIDPEGLRGMPGGARTATQPMPNMSFTPTSPYVGRQAGMQLIADSIGNIDFRTPSNTNWGIRFLVRRCRLAAR